jgi:hypothetical protein
MWRGLGILTVAILVVVLFIHAGPMRINQYRMRAAVKLLCRRGTNAPMFALGDMDEARPSVIRCCANPSWT